MNILNIKEKYLTLCKELVNNIKNKIYKDNDIKTRSILYYSKEIIINDINYLILNDSHLQKSIITEINIFYNNVIHQLDNQLDNNYIGMINIFLLQCIILFTSYNINEHYRFNNNMNNNYVIYNYLIQYNWKDYEFIKNSLKNIDNLKYLYKSKNSIFLIIIKKTFKINEIIESFLDNIFYCGFSYNINYADGILMTPFEFMRHDIIHGNNYFFIKKDLDIELLKEFYNYSKDIDKEAFKKINLIFFLIVHESYIIFFPSSLEKIENNIDSLFSYLQSSITRFIRTNDLGELIPKSYRTGIREIMKYLYECVDIYLIHLIIFYCNKEKTCLNKKNIDINENNINLNKGYKILKLIYEEYIRIEKIGINFHYYSIKHLYYRGLFNNFFP
jgi:hypothetical protein